MSPHSQPLCPRAHSPLFPRHEAPRLPGAGACAERSLALIAGIRSAASLVLKAPPGSAASGRQARFGEPRLRRPPGGRWASKPWLWPRVDRGPGRPPAFPAAPTSRSPAQQCDPCPQRLWKQAPKARTLPKDRSGFKGTSIPEWAGKRPARPLTVHFASRSSSPPNRT